MLYTKNHNIVVGGLLIAIAGCLTGCGHKSFSLADENAKVGKTIQARGIMSTDELIRVGSLEDKVAQGGSLSEGEVDWLLSIVDRTGTYPQKAMRLQFVGFVFGACKRSSLPSSRVANVFDLGRKMIRFTGTEQERVPSIGCVILGRLQDKRATVYLTPLLTSSSPRLRVEARTAINKLNRPT